MSVRGEVRDGLIMLAAFAGFFVLYGALLVVLFWLMVLGIDLNLGTDLTDRPD